MTEDFLPPRPQSTAIGTSQKLGRFLGQAQDAALNFFRSHLDDLFGNVDDILFERARISKNNAEQDTYFSAMRDIRIRRDKVVQDSCIGIRRQFAAFAAGEQPAGNSEQRANSSTLSLVEETDLEENLAIGDMVSRSENHCLSQLYALNERFSVTVGGRVVDEENNPLAAKALCTAFREAYGTLKVDISVRLILLKLLDQYVIRKLNLLYEEVNQNLIEKGILPNLKPTVVERDQGETGHDSGQSMEPPEPDTPQPTSENANDPEHHGAPAPLAQDSAVARQLFETISGLLARRRQSHGALPPGVPTPMRQRDSAVAASNQDVLSVLSILQSEAGAADAGKLIRSRTPAQIKQALTRKLTDLGGGEQAPQLQGAEEDTVDLIGLLFEQFTNDDALDRVVKDEITRLQLPLLRLALMDQSFFTRPEHPARQLLSLISEIGSHWVTNGEKDRQIVPKLQRTVDRLLNEFDDDTEMFDQFCEELEKDVDKVKKRAKINEKRALEATKGKEKLQLAHRRAEEEVEKRTSKAEIPAFVEQLLIRSWANVMALTLLRHGDESEEWQAALAVADDLIASVSPKPDGESRKIWREKLPDLRKALEEGLTLVGHHHDDIRRIFGELSYCQGWALSAEVGTCLPQRLKETDGEVPGFGKDEKVVPAFGKLKAVPEPEAKVPANEKEREMMATLRRMPFGTWFDYTFNDEEAAARIKLAWYSPVSSKCLFVDKRGNMVVEKSLLSVARDMTLGRAEVAQREKLPFVDRALHAIADLLGRAMPVAAL